MWHFKKQTQPNNHRFYRVSTAISINCFITWSHFMLAYKPLWNLWSLYLGIMVLRAIIVLSDQVTHPERKPRCPQTIRIPRELKGCESCHSEQPKHAAFNWACDRQLRCSQHTHGACLYPQKTRQSGDGGSLEDVGALPSQPTPLRF